LTIGADYNRESSGARAFTARSRAECDRLFRAAVRHSRGVRVIRLVLPVTILLSCIAMVVAATWLDPLRALAKLPIDLGSVVVSGTKITMQQPRLAGFTRDARPYEVVAAAAAQDVTKPDLLELHDINAKMEMQGKGKMEVTAKDGIYDTKTGLLTLKRDIVVTSSSGYTGLLSEAVIDVHKNNVVSEQPVQVKMLQGTVDSKRLEVKDSGELVLFDGGVTLVMTMPAKPGDPKAVASTPPASGRRSAEAK
jgi:lipopolysaccharide export system protein LptC